MGTSIDDRRGQLRGDAGHEHHHVQRHQGTPTSWGAAGIVVPVPSAATTGAVVVTVGAVASNSFIFTVTASAPTLTSLTPVSGTIGTPVTIAGELRHDAGHEHRHVQWDHRHAHHLGRGQHCRARAERSHDRRRRRDRGRRGEQRRQLHGDCGADLDKPTPSSGAVGTAVTIAGANFGATQGTSTITFNGTRATPTSWSAASIVVPVPSAATTGNVVVTVGGVASNGVSFAVTVPPSITSLSQTSGAVGTSVTIAGTNFGATQGTSTVTFNGTAGTPTSLECDEHHGAGAERSDDGECGGDGRWCSEQRSEFRGDRATEHQQSESNRSGAVGTVVTIMGTNFGGTQGSSTVSFNGTAATPTILERDQHPVAPVPCGSGNGQCGGDSTSVWPATGWCSR